MTYTKYCLNGHYAGSAEKARARSWPELKLMAARAEAEEPQPPKLFCPQCGTKLIQTCPQCSAKIEVDLKRPAYCAACGKPFPWTEMTLISVKKFTDRQEGLTADEKEVLKGAYDDLTHDAPTTRIAANWFNGLLQKLAPDVAETIRKTFIEIVSSTTAKLINP